MSHLLDEKVEFPQTKIDCCPEVVLRNQKDISILFIGCLSSSVVAASFDEKVV